MSKVAKYGKFMHLEKLLQGTFRAAIATTYKDITLAAAQQDDELMKTSLMSATTMIGIPTPTGMHYTQPLGRVVRSTEIRQSYFMSSLSYCVDDSEPKFSAFGDARLLIRDPATFGKRVCSAAQIARPKWFAFFAPVHYFNPENGYPNYLLSDPPAMRDSLPWRLKANSYSWQKEWRFIWITDTESVSEPKSIEFQIGSLSDIAVLEQLKT